MGLVPTLRAGTRPRVRKLALRARLKEKKGGFQCEIALMTIGSGSQNFVSL